MPILILLAAVMLLVPALGLGVATAALALAAAVAVGLTAVALGATGCLFNWILAALAVGLSCRAVRSGRRLVERLRHGFAQPDGHL
ncbi:MAG: hypothetical protein R6U88_03180 [Candidatus Bipolaricaulota bacterium]